MGIEGTYPSIIKVVYDKPTANININVEKVKVSSQIRNNTKMFTFVIFIQYSLEVTAMAIREEKEIKGIQIGKEEAKWSPFADYRILYIENSKMSLKLPELIYEFGKVAGYKINTQESLEFLYTNNEIAESKIKRTVPLNIAMKRIIYLEINFCKEMKDLYLENYKTLMKEIKEDTDGEICHVIELED